jgi:hypothetical protein
MMWTIKFSPEADIDISKLDRSLVLQVLLIHYHIRMDMGNLLVTKQGII